jgi:hypothetical protein
VKQRKKKNLNAALEQKFNLIKMPFTLLSVAKKKKAKSVKTTRLWLPNI